MNALAERLAEHIAASPVQRVELVDLYAAAVAFDRSLATTPSARSEIREALDELVAAGQVVFPVSRQHFDTREEPPLPKWVRLPPRRRPGRAPRDVRVWPAALEVAGRIAARDDEIGVLEIAAVFLRDKGASRPSVPVRERSLELFGDEKRLDRLKSTRLFTSGALTMDLLRCHEVPIPFVSQWVAGAPDPRGTALLIAENHHTYTSLLEATRLSAAAGGPARYVGYGTGSQFPSAVLSVPLLSPPPDRIVYFGDVDLNGLQIPATASLNSQRAGLPVVEPAYSLYDLLFATSYRRPAEPVAEHVAAQVAGWMGPMAGQAQDVLTAGTRIPQEAVGYELLMARLPALDAA